MIKFYLNGKFCEVDARHSTLMLSDYLRYEKCLTGTKVVCAEGDCGACTVLRYSPMLQGLESENFQAVNSCIMPMAAMHGMHLITIEGLEKDQKMHQAQEKMMSCHGSQCGFCTPGFVMALAGLSEEKINRNEKAIDPKEAKNALTGNLCRCTGYDTIVKAACTMDLSREESLKARYHNEEIEKHLSEILSKDLKIEESDYQLFAPTSYKSAIEYLQNNLDAKIIANATDLGVVHNKRRIKLNNLLSLHLIKEAYEITYKEGIVNVGARVTLSEFRHFLKDKCVEYVHYLDIFAAPQIKNNATLIGNVATASPIGDNAPILLALDASVIIQGPKGERVEKLSDFFLDYRKTTLKNDELISAISFEIPKERTLKFFKNSIRKDLDISTINLGLNVKISNDKIEDILIGAGGIAAIPLKLRKTEDFLRGKKLEPSVIKQACDLAQTEYTPISDVRSTSSYRRVVFENVFTRALGAMS
tara:strand:+ start:319234 stop:320658 length:1425 start_codon:yes stop_codon:yes gene_type:complete